MALPQAPDAESTNTTLAPVAGSNRLVGASFFGESGFAGTLNDATYGTGGPSAFRVDSYPLAGNQLWLHTAWFDEADIAGRADDTIIPVWSATPPSVSVYVFQYNDVDQGVPINDHNDPTVDSNPSGSPPATSVDALDGGVVVQLNMTGNNATFSYTNFTEIDSQGLTAFNGSHASQAIASASTVNNEYSPSTAPNRSAIGMWAINEVGSVGVAITDFNGGNPASPGDNNLVITGSSFEASQGTGKVTLSPTDNVNDANAVDITTVDSWSDTSIQFDIPRS
jgi:hypothetical protein